MKDVGKEEVIEESAAKKQRLDVEDAGTEELEQDQEMDEGDEEEEVEDGDEEEEEEENEELTKDRCGCPHLLALSHTCHGVMYQPSSSQK